jgi:Flp pilus assembly protein TadG
MSRWYNKMNCFKILKDESGQALVEVAFASTILVLLLIGVIDFGRFDNDGLLVANSARAGVQYAVQSNVAASSTPHITSAASNDEGNSFTITATPTVTQQCVGGLTIYNASAVCSSAQSLLGYHSITRIAVAVTPSGSFAPMLRYPGIPTSISISHAATMQISP